MADFCAAPTFIDRLCIKPCGVRYLDGRVLADKLELLFEPQWKSPHLVALSESWQNSGSRYLSLIETSAGSIMNLTGCFLTNQGLGRGPELVTREDCISMEDGVRRTEDGVRSIVRSRVRNRSPL